MKRKLGLGALVVFAAIQVYRPGQEAFAVDPGSSLMHSPKLPEDVRTTLREACADCHSRETRWPWYARIAPPSWYTAWHVETGRKAMNLSIILKQDRGAVAEQLGFSCDLMRARQMPPKDYVWLHPSAKLSEEQMDRFCKFAVGWE